MIRVYHGNNYRSPTRYIGFLDAPRVTCGPGNTATGDVRGKMAVLDDGSMHPQEQH